VRFALQSAEFTAVTVIIVLSLRTEQGQRECGIVVDSVSDVVDLAPDSIRQPPSMQSGGSCEFIEGITTSDEQMLILLDADELVTRELSPMELPGKAA
jgi:purine-binding chemotaxis protein CheW